jgi:hypothetical protein
MRKWCGPFLSAAMVLALAAPSLAETKAFSATFSLSLGSFPPFEAKAAGNLDATITGGEVTAFTLPADTFKLAKITPVDPPITVVKTPIKLTLTNVSVEATIAKGDFNQADGKAPSVGESILFFNKGDVTAKIPLDDAIGTTATINTTLLGIVPMKLEAKKWTTGTATLTTVPLGGGAEQKVQKKGAFEAPGSFTFVAPTQITISVPGGTPSKIASFGQLDIDIEAPEAANMLLLATGAAVLALIGYRRSAA